MTKLEIEHKMTNAFRGGEILRRELRLSGEEVDYITGHYPASVTPMGAGDTAWYEIIFRGADC